MKSHQSSQKISKPAVYAQNLEKSLTLLSVLVNVLAQYAIYIYSAYAHGSENNLTSQKLSTASASNGLPSTVKCVKPIISIGFIQTTRSITQSKYQNLPNPMLCSNQSKKMHNFPKFSILFRWLKTADSASVGKKILISNYHKISQSQDITPTSSITSKNGNS